MDESERRYVRDGLPVNVRGEGLLGYHPPDSQAYGEFSEYLRRTRYDLAESLPTAQQYGRRRADLTARIEQMPDAGERENAGFLLAWLDESFRLGVESAAAYARLSPQYKRARELRIESEDLPADAMWAVIDQIAQLAEEGPARERRAILSESTLLFKIIEARQRQ